MKLIVVILTLTMTACSSVKVIEKNTDGGTLKFRKRGLTSDLREEKAMSEANEHCKMNGFKTYQVESQSQDGRFLQVRFKCIN